MSLMGKAVMVAWHDLESGRESDHDDWHSHEHLFERVGIAGFMRGRRCRAIAAPEEYFLMYEVDDFPVLTSEAYLTRLNNPTEWSRRIIPGIRTMTRTLCHVRASFGGGLGSTLLTIRFTIEASERESLIVRLAKEVLPRLAIRKGIVGVHLLEGDDEASKLTTDEARLRGGGDRIADLVLVVEGYDPDELSRLPIGELSTARLIELGVGPEIVRGVYGLAHAVSESDLPKPI